MIDMSIGLGTGKILTVLALNAHHHQLSPAAPGLQNVHCMAVSVAYSWTGESIAAFLEGSNQDFLRLVSGVPGESSMKIM